MNSKDTIGTNACKKRIFLSYCHADAEIAQMLLRKLEALQERGVIISQDIQDVGYRDSFHEFMKSIREHEFVLMIISDSYIKSLNCMYEVTEVFKDSHYGKRLLFFVLSDEDRRYFPKEIEGKIAADVYSVRGQAGYIRYWQQREQEISEMIAQIGDPVYAQTQVDEKRKIMKILLELPEFFRYLQDARALSLSAHIDENFRSIERILYGET